MRKHLSYANVLATLALIIAVAGIPTAVAVTKGGKGAVVRVTKSSDVSKKGNIRAGKVTTAELADSALTAGKLGPVEVVQASGNINATATCPAGTRLLSGGGSAGSTTPEPLTISLPSGNGWTVASDGIVSVRAAALCLKG